MEMSEDCMAAIKLSAIKGLGLKTFHKLYAQMGSVQGILGADYHSILATGIKAPLAKKIVEQGGQASISPKADARVQKVQSWLSETQRYVYCLDDENYPDRFKHIYHCPPIIYLEGNPSILKSLSVAIVGSRRASLSALKHASKFAAELAESGVNVVSGMALGVDAEAHKGALSREGQTTAVLGTGLDVIYPRQNSGLTDRLKRHGLIVSEMPLGTMPMPANFPRRNRLVSGLSDGVLVVEANEKSGSLITAKFALEQNKEVFALPGQVDNPGARGANRLIQQGAQLVLDAAEIIESLSFRSSFLHSNENSYSTRSIEQAHKERSIHCDQDSMQENIAPVDLSSDERKVYEAVSYSPVSFDDIVAMSDLGIPEVMQILMMLELKGVVGSVAGGYQRFKTVNSPATA